MATSSAAFAEHEPQQPLVIGAEGEPHGELVLAARHRSGHYAEQPHRRKQQRPEGERR